MNPSDPTDSIPGLDPGALALVEQALRKAPAPTRAREGLRRVLERCEDPGALVAALGLEGLRRAAALLGLGGAPLLALQGSPQDLLALASSWDELPEVSSELDADGLRVLRRRATLALASRELSGELEATEAAGRLSVVADRLLQAALELARARVARRLPDARGARLVVLALGKLGGSELNYSSDVDLILVRADEAPSYACEQIARTFVGLVQERAIAGRLFRVDLRLRPYGKSGALIPRASGLLTYYQETGRPWERQAWLRARPSAGDLELGAEVLQSLAPFLWTQRLDARGIESMVELRARMSARLEDPERDVKQGPGGIRDVEFAVQFLQLLHGEALPQLRTPNTEAAITRLREANLLRPEEADALTRSYRFLRRLEHLLQLTLDREVTRLPRGEALAPWASSLGLGREELEARFARTQLAARSVLDGLLRTPFAPAEDEEELDLRDLLLNPQASAQEAAPLLEARGFLDPRGAWKHLQGLLHEDSPWLAPSGRARTLLAGLAPRLLDAITARPEPDRSLRNLERATAGLGAKATLYQLLAETPDALHLLVSLAAGSEVLVEALRRHPGVFDEVVDRLLQGARPIRAEVAAEVRVALGARAKESALRELRALHLLWVGMPDLAGKANVQNTARALADLNEGTLQALLEHSFAESSARHGPPSGALTVLALGKLGGRELSYASDCDLILVHTPGPDPQGRRSASAFWCEVIQRAIALGEGAASIEGPLLAIDLRLRPGGGKGPLSVSLRGALNYYRGEGPGEAARDFERLALQKARPLFCFGEPGEEEPWAALEAVLYERLYGPELWEEVATMRARQRAAALPGDLKRARGSLADVELVASALALQHGGSEVRLRLGNTAHLLAALEQAGHLEPGPCRDLRTGYSFLRRLDLKLRVRDFQARALLPEEPALSALARALDYAEGGSRSASYHFQEELAYHRERIALHTAALIERGRSGLGGRGADRDAEQAGQA